jgi:CBS domain-containing protein
VKLARTRKARAKNLEQSGFEARNLHVAPGVQPGCEGETKMLVEDLMTRNVASVRSDQSLAVAARLMWDCDCGALPVVDADSAKVVGMITDRDICMATWSRGLAPGEIRAREVMSDNLVTCQPRDAIARAEQVLRTKQIRRLPVVDSERRLLGILSLADIARAAGATSKLESDRDLSSDVLATTLAGICMAPAQAMRSPMHGGA